MKAIAAMAGIIFAAYGLACYNDGMLIHGVVIAAAGAMVTATAMCL